MNAVVPLYGYLQLNANTPPGNESDNELGSSIRSLLEVTVEVPEPSVSPPSSSLVTIYIGNS